MVGKAASSQFLRFVCVGGIGFLVDGGLLFALIRLDFDPYLARFISFPVAVLATWLLNRRWTFSGANRARPGRQLNRYLGVQTFGAICNYLVYAQTLQANDETQLAAAVGFALGSALGMLVNFVGARVFVFKD